MQFLTQALSRPVYDNLGERIGKVSDIIVTPADPLPFVSGLAVEAASGQLIIKWKQIREEVGRFTLVVRRDRAQDYTPTDDDIWLRKDVLDRQIVDVHDYKVVRVNDARFVEIPGKVCLLGVDASTRGLLRELHIEWLADALRKVFRQPIGEKIIAWNDVETFHRQEGPIKLRIPLQKLSQLHPSDIADIIEQMNPMQRAEVIESLDVETAAEVLPEASPEIQAEIIEDLDPEHAADVLEEMDPDEAADILGDLSEESQAALLAEMEPEEAEDVRELLEYEDETAGGLMTTDYMAIPDDMTSEGTIAHLRELKPDAETIYYIYVVTGEEMLVGVISLRDLIISEPTTPIRDSMITRVIHVHPDATVREVAELFQKYNLLAIPVVDFDNKLLGIVTVDDMLEHIPSHAWRGRTRSNELASEKILQHPTRV